MARSKRKIAASSQEQRTETEPRDLTETRDLGDHGANIRASEITGDERRTKCGKRRRGFDGADGKGNQIATESGENGNEAKGVQEDSTDSGELKENGPAGSTAFGRAFQKIMKKKLPSSNLNDAMGPVLSAHKQLITMKLEEAATVQKAKTESKKEKQAFREKGHTIPAQYLGGHDRELIKLATKGVVKLFNAVSKSQNVQAAAKAFTDSELKDVAKQSKSTFLAALQDVNGTETRTRNVQNSGRLANSVKEEVTRDQSAGWSALQDTFMIGKSRLKDWDRKEDAEADWQSADSSADGSFSQ